MICPKCHEPVENGSAFCGNCGQSLSVSTIAQVLGNQVPDTSITPPFFPVGVTTSTTDKLPTYVIPNFFEQKNHLRATLSAVFGLVGIVGAINMPIAGIILGICGIVLATLSMRSFKHALSRFGLIASIVSVLFGGTTWLYAITSHQKLVNNNNKIISATNTTPAQATDNLVTPCYTVKFATKVNIENVQNSCFMNAYNAVTMDQSTDAYKVLATTTSLSVSNFLAVAKQSLEADVKQSLKGFTINKETSGLFAASPAYFVTANNGTGVSIVEAAVLHLTNHGENFFVLVHAVNGTSADLLDLQLGWSWE